MWTDNDTDIDLINYDHLVQSAIDIIQNDNLLPCTIGIYGEWGSGKSSLMRLIQKELESDDKILTIKFNGWLFEGYEDAKGALLEVVLTELERKKKKGQKIKDKFKKIYKKIKWLKMLKTTAKYATSFAVMAHTGVPASGLPKGSVTQKDAVGGITKSKLDDFDFLKREEEPAMLIRDLHNDFEEILKATTIDKVVVFVDDLDRCNPNTIIETLEAIKLFLFLKNTSFVISADERIIEQGVKTKFKEVYEDELSLGRQYLEKLIQFPIHIPRLSSNEMETYINLLFTNLYIKEPTLFEKLRDKVINISGEELYSQSSSYHFLKAKELLTELKITIEENNVSEFDDALLLSSQITDILTTKLQGNPRQCKRFLNTLLMRVKMAKAKKCPLNKRVLAKIMLIEYFKPEAFKNLAEIQEKEQGFPRDLKLIEGDNKNNLEFLESWKKDEFLSELITDKPLLSEHDLRPYFYFSRESLQTLKFTNSGMSPKAVSICKKLLKEELSDTEKKRVFKEVEVIDSMDVTHVYNELTKAILKKENSSSVIELLFELGLTRSEIIADILNFIKELPASKIKIKFITSLKKIIKKDSRHTTEVKEILSSWSQDENNPHLAKLASKNLTKMEGNG